MSVSQAAGLKPHDLAKAEIEAWRGRCLNVFARGEKAVTDSLICASTSSCAPRLEPLAGHRLNSLAKLVAAHDATKPERELLCAAIAEWRRHDEKRPLFSHGVATELLDRHGLWHAQIDFLAVHKGAATPVRATFTKPEAEQFETNLHQAFTKLAGQLGQFRKRCKP